MTSVYRASLICLKIVFFFSSSRKEMRDWSKVMIERLKELKPLIVCFNGKGIYEIFSGSKCDLGLQTEPVDGTDIVSVLG